MGSRARVRTRSLPGHSRDTRANVCPLAGIDCAHEDERCPWCGLLAEEATTNRRQAAPQRVVVIANPEAGQRGPLPTGAPVVESVSAALDAVGLSYELLVPADPHESRRLVRTAVAEGAELVVAAGGDGTVRLIASELVGTSVVLGVLPLGTVMNLARMLDIPLDLPEAARLLVTGQTRTLDIGELDGTHFFEGVSLGLSSEVFRAFDDLQEGRLGSLLRLMRAVRRARAVRTAIDVDGQRTTVRALAVLITTGPYVGAALAVVPAARIDDGSLEVVIFPRFSAWDLLHHFALIAFGRARSHPHIRRMSGRHIRVATSQPLPVRVDGSDHGTTPVEVRLAPHRLTVVAGRPERTRRDRL